MQKSKVYLYGKGGHSNVVTDVLASQGIDVVATFDDDSTRASAANLGMRLRNEAFPQLDHPLIITIGDNAMRSEIAKNLDCDFGVGIHSSAIIAPSVTIDEGTVVLQGAIIQANTKIGKHVLINTGASVDHDNVIGDFAHISPQAVLCGHVEIGEGTHVGATAVVVPSIKIGKWCTIGAGSVVINNIPDFCTAVGNPARVIKQQLPPLQSPTASSGSHFDLAIVGSGLASTSTLLNLIKRLESDALRRKLNLAVFEAKGEFFGGIAYGSATGTKSLLITSLKDFLPEPELSEFKDWLSNNKEWAFDQFRINCGEQTVHWLEVNAQAMNSNDWDQLFLPRYLFGLFLKSIGLETLNKAVEKGLISFELIQASVHDIERINNRFRIDFRRSKRNVGFATADQVVLAIGSAPFRQLFNEKVYSPQLGGLVIDNPYSIGVTNVFERISRHLKLHGWTKCNLALIGSNATMIEVIYNMCDIPGFLEGLGKVTVVSPSCEWPDRITEKSTNHDFDCHHLKALSQSPEFTATEIFVAVKNDILNSKKEGFSFSDSFDTIATWMNKLVARLSEDQKLEFVSCQGIAIGRLQRRAGGQYCDAIQRLKDAGILRKLSARFLEISENSSAGLRFDYLDNSGARHRSDDQYQVVINCTGFEPISPKSSNALIRNLLKRKLASANPSGMGLIVDSQLAASQDLYVVGPLMGGNIIGKDLVWHAEHCGRIIRFSKLLVSHILDGFLNESRSKEVAV
jgi:sugar O-acyltransferase (sialic acid O-acetyltransferase NeuD family)